MNHSDGFRYCAFLSYSHRDGAWARWLHRALEHHRIDKDLIGRETRAGRIPRSLRPIFRDRDDLSAGKPLAATIVSALSESRALIVLCSPNSAKSHYVDEEVRQFKLMGRSDRVIPIIVDGEPGHSENECYPPALRYKLGPDGAATDEREELIAADARDQGDGRKNARLKVVAGLLGLDLDEIIKREAVAEKRRARVRRAIGAAILALATASFAGFAWARHEFRENTILLDRTLQRGTSILDEATALSERFGVPRSISLTLLRQSEDVFSDIAELGRESPQILYRKAWMRIQFARNYATLGDADKRRTNADAARRIMESLALDQPDNMVWQRGVSVTYNELGDLLAEDGRLDEALPHYQTALHMRQQLVARDDQSPELKRDLMVSYFKVGDVFIERGLLEDATGTYSAGFEIAKALVLKDAENQARQRDLAIGEEKLGRLKFEQCELPAALTHYQASLNMRQSLALTNRGNIESERDLMVVRSRIADVLLAQGDLPGALAGYRLASEIGGRLVAADESNVMWRRDLAALRETIADVTELGPQAAFNASVACSGGKRHRGAQLSTHLINVAAVFLGRGYDAEGQKAIYASAAAVTPYGDGQYQIAARKQLVFMFLALGDVDKAAEAIISSRAIFERRFGVSDARTVSGRTALGDVLNAYGGDSAERWTAIVKAFRRLRDHSEFKEEATEWLARAEARLAALSRPSSSGR